VLSQPLRGFLGWPVTWLQTVQRCYLQLVLLQVQEVSTSLRSAKSHDLRNLSFSFFWQCTEWCRPLVRNVLMILSNMMSPHSCRGLEQALRVPRVMEDALVFCLQDLDPRGLIEPLEAGWLSKYGGSSAVRRRTHRAFPWPGAAIALLQRFAQEICCRASYLAGKASRRCPSGADHKMDKYGEISINYIYRYVYITLPALPRRK
jgi:hypothetical protein